VSIIIVFMYRIRVGKSYFREPHYVTSVTRYSWGELKEVSVSMQSLTRSYWKRKRRDIAEKLISELLVSFPDQEYTLEEYEGS
jgi:hypothetical protein